MILVVGPNTPASLLMGCHRLVPPLSSSSASSSPSEASAIEEEDGERQDDVVPMEEEVATPRSSGRSRWVRQQRPASEEDDKSDQDEGEVDDEGEGEVEDQDQENREALENLLMNYYPNHEESESEESSVDLPTDTSSLDPVPSMRHGGCINTAAWLSCGWRISTNGDSREALTTEECPTQLVTSGDDLLVKFWDVSHAMGISPPLSGGYATICPFSSPNVSHGQDSTQSKWKRYYSGIHSDILAGSVVPLVTLSTGHSNNVFHVTPLYGHPGKVATCAADGFLRLADLETGISRVVVSPEYEDDIGGLFRGGLMSLRPGMCFSHHFLSQKTGLLCSERGLRPFDLRLPPREQSTRSLLGGSYRGCKSCAIWSKSQSTSSLEESDSAYVFGKKIYIGSEFKKIEEGSLFSIVSRFVVGGSSAEVVLCDLRMTDGASSRVIQKYCPQNLALADIISVSGIDISRDGRELLVSYESDQIYTFPIFPRSRCSAGPTVDEIGRLSDERQTEVLPELACYGGHLNRFTFLKVCSILALHEVEALSRLAIHSRFLLELLRMPNMQVPVMNTSVLDQTLGAHGFMTRLRGPSFPFSMRTIRRVME